MRLLDPQTFQFTGKANYLNHPPMFYALLAALGPKLEGHPQALLALSPDRCRDRRRRLCGAARARPCRALSASGILRLRRAARLHSGAGADRRRGQQRQSRFPRRRRRDARRSGSSSRPIATAGLRSRLLGVVAASWAKLTGLPAHRRRWSSAVIDLSCCGAERLRWTVRFAAALRVRARGAPYFDIHAAQYGSPTPETPAQIALLADGARAAGWADLPRKSFPAYLVYFVGAFVADWMPTLGARSAFNYAMLVDSRGGARLRARRHRAVAAPPVAPAGNRARRRRRSPERCAIVATFAIHVYLQLRPPSRDRLADGRLSALLPAARRDRTAGRPVACSPRSKRRAGAPRCWHF